jgi:hypothetical protein
MQNPDKEHSAGLQFQEVNRQHNLHKTELKIGLNQPEEVLFHLGTQMPDRTGPGQVPT